MTPRAEIAELIQRLRPIQTQFNLMRVGSRHDGGYLVPDDLGGISMCFSPGVDVNAAFELDLLNRFGINSHLADYSVDAPPMGFQPLSFTKKYIGAVNDEMFITLNKWIETCTPNDSDSDCLLQMDIEGHEYVSLLSIDEALLQRFRIVIIEFHNLRNWGEPKFFELVKAAFDRLLKYFYVVHIHPNNDSGLVNLWDIPVPRLLEMTLLRKDRSEPGDYCQQYPHRFDAVNTPDRSEIVLPPYWYGRSMTTS